MTVAKNSFVHGTWYNISLLANASNSHKEIYVDMKFKPKRAILYSKQEQKKNWSIRYSDN